MSDEETPASEVPAGPPAPKSPKAVLGLLAANFAVSGFIAFKVLTMTAAAHAAPAHEPEHAEPTSREVKGSLVALDPFVVNLDEPGSPRYLKVSLQAEVRQEDDAKVFEKNKVVIHDEVLGYLSGLHVAQTLGTENKDKIRTDLAERMGKVIGADRVRRIVFTEFVVQ